MSDRTRLYHPVPGSTQWLPTCRICNDPVLLETSKTDEHGQAVHEDCYVLNLSLNAEFLIAGGSVPGSANRHATYQPCEATMAEDRDSPISRQLAVLATMLMQRAKHVSWHKQPWSIDLAAVVTVLVLTCWIAYSDRHSASSLGSSEVQRSVAIDEQALLPPAKGSSRLPAVRVLVEEATTASLLQEGRVGENEVVHIGEDVTVRYFTPLDRHSTN